MKKTLFCLLAIIVVLGLSRPAKALVLVIDNDISSGTLGHFSVDVTTGGESDVANLTANRFYSDDQVTVNVFFDYFSYVDVGSGGFRLSGSDPSFTGDEVTSSGSFTASGSNIIDWAVVSSMSSGIPGIITNTFTFNVSTDTQLGIGRFYQYLDVDIEDYSDDIFFTRGSVAGQDLELFTVDNLEVYGISQGGAFGTSQGLVNSSFAGWAAAEFDGGIDTSIETGTQSVSTAGVIDLGSAFNHLQVGLAYGPLDIVSVLGMGLG